jgi:hypothetical protein
MALGSNGLSGSPAINVTLTGHLLPLVSENMLCQCFALSFLSIFMPSLIYSPYD